MATTPHPAPKPPPPKPSDSPPKPAAAAFKEDDPHPERDFDTTQEDQIARSLEMESMGVAAYMKQENDRAMAKSPPIVEPRQVHGVTPPEKPDHRHA